MKLARSLMFGIGALTAVVAPYYVTAECDPGYCPSISMECPLSCWPSSSWWTSHCYYGTRGECCECFYQHFVCDCPEGPIDAFIMSGSSNDGECKVIDENRSACSPKKPIGDE